MDYVKKIWDKAIQDFVKKNDIEGLERYYQDVILKTTAIDEDTRREYEEIVDGAISEVNNKLQNINAEDITVGETAKHFKLSKKKIAIISGAIGAVAALAGVTIGLVGCSRSNKGSAEAKSKISSDYAIELDFSLDDGAEIGLGMNANKLKPTLHFNPEKTETMIKNMRQFITTALPSGIEFTDDELEEQIESLINYYVWLNLDEIGPSYLSELYQTDSTSYIEIFSDSIYWANVLRFDSITSSMEGNTVPDLSSLISNKKDLELVQSFQNLNARLHDAVVANDIANIKGIVSEYQEVIRTKLLDHISYRYGQGSMDLCFRLVYSAEQLLADYNLVIMDESLSKTINEDEFLKCLQSVSIATKEDKPSTDVELEQIIQTNTSKKSDNVIYIVDTLKDYMSRLDLSKDFTRKKSVADVMIEVSSFVRENNLFETYVANESLEELFLAIFNQTHVQGDTITSNDVITSDGSGYVKESEFNKYNIDTNGKTPSQIEQEYQQAVKNEVESSLANEKNFTDNKGEVLESGVNSPQYAEEYSNGFGAGSKQGAIDGNALTTYNATVTGSVAYQEGYKAGYERSYEKAKQTRLNIERQSNVTIETIKPVEQSSQVTEQGTYSQPETKKPTVENPQQSTSAPSTKEEETTTGIIEEVVIDEGILEEGVTSVSEVDYLTFLRDYLQSYNQTSMEEETKKTR